MDYLFLYIFTVLLFVRPMDFIPLLQGWQILDFVAYGGLVILLSKRDRLHPGPHNILIFGFFLAGLLSHLINTYMQGMIETFPLLFKLLLLYLFVANALTSPKRFRAYLDLLSVLCVILAMNSLYQMDHESSFFGGAEPVLQPLRDRDGNLTGQIARRITGIGIFNDPNDLGQFLLFGGMISVGSMIGHRSWFVRLIHLGLTSIYSIAIYHTNSRGTIVAAFASLAFYVIRRRKRLFPKVVVTLLMLFLFMFGPSQIALISAGQARDRLELWSTAITLFKRSPLWGVGVGMFQDAADTIFTAHQSYLLILAETGIIGYFLWFGMILLFFLTTSRIRSELAPETLEEAQLLLLFNILEAAMFGFVIAAYFLSRSYQFPLFALLGMAPAMVLIVRKSVPEFRLAFGRRAWNGLTASVFGSVGFLYLTTKLMWLSI